MLRRKHRRHIGFGNDFLDMTLKNTGNNKTKIEKLGFIKIKNVCALKNTIKRVKRQAIERKKIFSNHICDEINIQN